MSEELPPPKLTLGSFIPSVEKVLEWMRANPTLYAPFEFKIQVASLYNDVDEKEILASYARSVPKTEVSHSGEYISLSYTFGARVHLHVLSNRNAVCERRVVGTKEIAETIIPAHTEEIVEWDCGSILSPSPSTPGQPKTDATVSP